MTDPMREMVARHYTAYIKAREAWVEAGCKRDGFYHLRLVAYARWRDAYLALNQEVAA